MEVTGCTLGDEELLALISLAEEVREDIRISEERQEELRRFEREVRTRP